MSHILLSNIEQREVVPGYFARFVHTENMTLSYFEIRAGAEMPEHSHHSEQVSNVIKGEFELNVEGTVYKLKPDSVVKIPSNARHSGKALTDCYIIDAFYPVREDYRN
ncbi:cupin domain-containing protein [Bacteroidota bacterium]